MLVAREVPQLAVIQAPDGAYYVATLHHASLEARRHAAGDRRRVPLVEAGKRSDDRHGALAQPSALVPGSDVNLETCVRTLPAASALRNVSDASMRPDR